MAFGMKTAGDFRDIVKYDARAGRLFRVDGDGAGQKQNVEIPQGTQFAFDIATLEAGFVAFTAQGPTRAMVPWNGPGTPLPAQPQDKDADGKLTHRAGFWALIAGAALGGVREWCSNAGCLIEEVDRLWTKASAMPEAATGKIPLVAITGTYPVVTGTGAKRSTNYAPVFEIRGWVDRPKELGPRTVQLSHAPARPPAAQSAPAMQPPPPAAAMQPPPAAHQSAAAPDEMPF